MTKKTRKFSRQALSTKLSENVTVADYLQLEAEENREAISEFIQNRFFERYVLPLKGPVKHGFTTMAISCLLIETLESFYRGWPDTSRQSELAFCSFISRTPRLNILRGHAQAFYRHVRCGILHQAETTGGWKIIRGGKLFDESTKTLNASRFHQSLENSILDYCKELGHSDWDSEIWVKFRQKMNSICKNCEP